MIAKFPYGEALVQLPPGDPGALGVKPQKFRHRLQELPQFGDDALSKYVTRMDKLQQLTPLGKIWSYNNAGFTLAGRVIEAVTGQTYEQAVRELVLDPLGMDHSF